MARKIFVNLPVSDLPRTIEFFTGLGFEFDARITDDSATGMIVNEDATVMLLTEKRFSDFTKKPLVDASTHTEAILCVSADSRDGVDELVNKALAAGATPALDPMDMGFMYGWSFYDLDGHHWEVMWMDEAAAEAAFAEPQG